MSQPEDLLHQLRTEKARAEDPSPVRQPEDPQPDDGGLEPRRISRRDDEWPHSLTELPPNLQPEHLYVEGRPLVASSQSLAVVGTRRPTAAGIQAAEELTRGLVEAGFTIVSGLALGIDAVAHRTALRSGGYTVAVLGCGLDVDYPSRNLSLKNQIRKSGTLVTEYDPGVQPQPHFFPMRNRIVAGLADGVLVVEGGPKSGALITARFALDFNRKVWAVPGSIRNAMAQGPNQLIRAGEGCLVTSVEHIFSELAPGRVWDDPSRRPPLSVESLSDEERDVLCVLDDVVVPADRIGRLTGVPPGRLALALSQLEVRGMVARRGAGYEISGAGGRVRAFLVEAD